MDPTTLDTLSKLPMYLLLLYLVYRKEIIIDRMTERLIEIESQHARDLIECFRCRDCEGRGDSSETERNKKV